MSSAVAPSLARDVASPVTSVAVNRVTTAVCLIEFESSFVSSAFAPETALSLPIESSNSINVFIEPIVISFTASIAP